MQTTEPLPKVPGTLAGYRGSKHLRPPENRKKGESQTTITFGSTVTKLQIIRFSGIPKPTSSPKVELLKTRHQIIVCLTPAN